MYVGVRTYIRMCAYLTIIKEQVVTLRGSEEDKDRFEGEGKMMEIQNTWVKLSR